MFNLRICGVSESQYWYNSKKYNTVIGFLDPNSQKNDYENYFLTYFHDVSEEIKGYVSPTLKDIEALLEFSKDFNKDTSLLVHCHAGISRSTAAAILVLFQHGLTAHQAFEKVKEVRDCCHPNSLMLKLGDEYFGGNNLMTEYEKFMIEQEKEEMNFKGQNDPTQSDVDYMKNMLKNLF